LIDALWTDRFNHEVVVFNALVLLYLMTECEGNGQYLIAFNFGKIVAVNEVGKQRKADELMKSQLTG